MEGGSAARRQASSTTRAGDETAAAVRIVGHPLPPVHPLTLEVIHRATRGKSERNVAAPRYQRSTRVERRPYQDRRSPVRSTRQRATYRRTPGHVGSSPCESPPGRPLIKPRVLDPTRVIDFAMPRRHHRSSTLARRTPPAERHVLTPGVSSPNRPQSPPRAAVEPVVSAHDGDNGTTVARFHRHVDDRRGAPYAQVANR